MEMIGKTLGNRYELLEKIGEGGTAVVYKAKFSLLNRFVAVKILKDEFSSDKDFVQKFKREATAAGSLSCNNIVNIYDVGTDGNINYIVLEYVDGKTLNEIIKESGRIQWEKAVDIAKQIALALNCAHSNGIIHRDIKPHNVLVTASGVVKVTDFGIAKASNSATITSSDKVMGSAHYLSPEQARGDVVDCKTDIYSLGIVMYEMVTGRVPFDAESPVSVALKHIQEPVIPPINVNPDIPASLNRIILKSVEKEPIRRYADAKELIADLNNVKDDLKDRDSLNDDYTRIMTPIKNIDQIKNASDSKKNEDDADKNLENGAEDEQEEEEEEEDVPDSRTERNSKGKLSKKKKYIIGATLACVLLIATLAIAYVAGLGGFSKLSTPANTMVTVPSVVGLSKNDAESKLKSVNLTPQFVNENSDKAVGTVTASDPNAGTSVKTGTTVKVTVSIGPKTQTVPDVSGNDLDTATSTITYSGFVVGSKSYSFSDSVPKNYVINTDPSANTKLAVGGTVNLVISKGPEVQKVTVPSVKGMTLDQAQAKLAGLTINVVTKQTGDKNQDNIVYDQDLAAGTSVKQGSAISIYVYKYDASQDAGAVALQKAKDAVATAQSTKKTADINNAKSLVIALPDGADKTTLTNQLNSITPIDANTNTANATGTANASNNGTK